MSIAKKLVQAIQSLYRQMLKLSRSITKKVMNWLLRSFMIIGRRGNFSRSGFILPTVTMVILVVVLLTTAIVLRSFDRTKNANNVRVDQALLNAAAPALARAKTKLDLLFADSRLPRSTPSETSLYSILADNANKKSSLDQADPKYTFAGETPLKLAYNLDSSSTIIDESNPGTASLENWETLSTAWRFPVDTDNNGKFDSFTLYAINFRTPSRNPQTGAFTRERTPLDSRTPPQDDGIGSGDCEAALTTSAKLVSQSGWYKAGSKLKKSFIVYTLTVPITKIGELGLDASKYENSQGSRGFSALEYQQDRSRIPLSNNAVVFEDDLTITPGQNLYLNGRVMTNSNLFITPVSTNEVDLWQVSSPESCFYQEENSKILVGGNVVNYDPTGTNRNNVTVDLFKPDTPPGSKDIAPINQSVVSAETAANISYNNKAYTDRINYLVQKWVKDNPIPTQPGTGKGVPNNNDPDDVKDKVKEDKASEAEKVRIEALTLWFEDRTRRVPFDEVAYDATGATPTFSGINYQGTGNSLRPPKAWMFPVDPADGQTATNYSNLTLNIASPKVQPPATEPETQRKTAEETQLGDRILVGNNLPAKWYKLDDYSGYDTNNNGIFVNDKEGQGIGTDTEWDTDDNNPKEKPRKRFSRVTSLGDVGDKGRDGFWEKAAAQAPKDILEGIGGLRVVTGAGVYERINSFLPVPVYQNPTTGLTSPTYDDPNTVITETFPIVWPDTMPMSPGLAGPGIPPSQVFNNSTGSWIPLTLPVNATNYPAVGPATQRLDPNSPQYSKGDLRMRATAVYHYATDAYQEPAEGRDQEQKPIACVSSYYDPSYYLVSGGTTYDSTKNLSGLPWNADPNGNGKSNNGISYEVGQTSLNIPEVLDSQIIDGKFPGAVNSVPLNLRLGYQANLVFPNGRFVNELLRDALQKTHTQRTLSEQSAIDSTLCALQILKGDISPTNGSVIPHGAIKEVAFLDGREIQRIDADAGATLANPISAPVEPFQKLQNAGTYNLRIEDRQPLEIRATQLDLNLLRRQLIPITDPLVIGKPPDGKEYLLPNSGIIYATRDDALPDLSAPLPTTAGLTEEQKKAQQKENSPLDYRLDPTRRPNGIMLINGEKLARADSQTFRDVEKGLILATNLPTYISKNFNLHTQQEFTEALANPVTRSSFYGRTTPNPQFACRPGDARLPGCTTGDEWRPATVIADSVNLLSNSFRFGYRNEGDYDLRNNEGWFYTGNRLANGFFDNNYVTNGLSSNNTAFGASRNFEDKIIYSDTVSNSTNDRDSSYFNNFVTPVQRRGGGDQFPEYVMEICRKLPVSECTPDDWVVGYDADANPINALTSAEINVKAQTLPSGALATRLIAGTTSTPPQKPSDQRFPRRIAFRRQPDNTLNLQFIAGIPVAVPLGINVAGQVAPFLYPTVPRQQDNSLWFRATANTAGLPWNNLNYNNNSPLSYLPPATEREEFLLPDVFNPAGGLTAFTNAVVALNGSPETPNATTRLFTGNDDLSDYSICTTTYGSRDYTGTLTAGLCPANAATAITTAINNLKQTVLIQTPTLSIGLFTTLPDSTQVRSDNFYIYPLPATPISGTVNLTGNRDTIFVFQSPSGGGITFNNFTLTLNGVDPNNIFWVSEGGVNFFLGANQLAGIGANQLAGNFIGTGNITGTAIIQGGRLLGFTAPFPSTVTLQGIASQNQPLLVPVLQLNVPSKYNFNPANNSNGDAVKDTNWLPRATETTFNVLVAAGNTPPRPNEADGGLQNFPRFLENWNGVDAEIRGSLLEFSRSAYADSPFLTVGSSAPHTSPIDPFSYFQLYRSDAAGGRTPYYTPPNRIWGYDVGLLSQLPDLFASRFTSPPAGPPDEFYREVSRDDEWVKTLLCGRIWNSNYSTGKIAINTDQRPTNYCP